MHSPLEVQAKDSICETVDEFLDCPQARNIESHLRKQRASNLMVLSGRSGRAAASA